jgi:hypothetical protein
MKREMFKIALLAICTPGLGLAQSSAPETFASAGDAAQSLYDAVRDHNFQNIAKVLGAPKELVFSNDAAQDEIDCRTFVQKYEQMHRIGRDPEGSLTLYIGAENWPFPIPLVEKSGTWRFDSDTGLKEALYRRIGENELIAIVTCHDFVAAERHYAVETNPANPPDSASTSLVAKAVHASAGGAPVLFYGYYFQVLPAPKAQGANTFTLVAYPATYRASGVMTFVVTGQDEVYEKDLGPNSAALARGMAGFHKDATWHLADE